MSKIDLEKLEDSQFDVLKEIGNIGAGNATTALATMLNIKVDMSVPNVALLPFDNISSFIGSEEQTVVGILLEIQGDIDGMMMFLFAPSAAIWRISSSIPVSANLARLELFLICVLSGSMQCNNPLILVTGSYKATPTHEPNPSVVNASGHLQTFKSAIPTLIIFPILLFPII